MKKIILIVMILLLGGCYDYNELTDLGIISSMIIDYKNDEYIINLEVLETKEDANKTSFFISSNGKTFESALNNIYKITPKHIYFNHIYAVIVSDAIAKDKLESIYDYFLIDADIRKDSYFVMSNDIDSIIKFQTEDKLSIGESIKSIIEYNESENGTFKTSKFREILHSNLNNCTYPLGSIKIDKNVLKLDDVYLIKDNKLDIKLDNMSLLLNILDNTKTIFTLNTNDDSFKIYKYKTKTKVEKNKIKIELNAEARLFGKTNSDSFKSNSLKKVEEKISNNLKSYIEDCISYSIKEKKDIYNFNYMYYKYYPNDTFDNTFINLDYEVNVKVTLNEKGLLIRNLEENKNER